MTIRLAKVIYWTTNTVAALMVSIIAYTGAVEIFGSPHPAGLLVVGALFYLGPPAVVCWLFGRGVLYVLAGR